MPEFLREHYKIRRATPKGGHEVSIPPAWLKHRKYLGYEEGEEIEVLYDNIIVIVPKGVRVDEIKLAAAVKCKIIGESKPGSR